MAKKQPPLPRITFTIPRDIMKFMLTIKRRDKCRSLQSAFEASMRVGAGALCDTTDIVS